MIDASIALLKCVIDYGLCIWAFSWFAKRKSENRALFLGSIFLSSLFLFGINMLEIPWLNTIVSAFTLLVLFLVVFYTRWQQALPLALILVTLCVICEFTPPLIMSALIGNNLAQTIEITIDAAAFNLIASGIFYIVLRVGRFILNRIYGEKTPIYTKNNGWASIFPIVSIVFVYYIVYMGAVANTSQTTMMGGILYAFILISNIASRSRTAGGRCAVRSSPPEIEKLHQGRFGATGDAPTVTGRTIFRGCRSTKKEKHHGRNGGSPQGGFRHALRQCDSRRRCRSSDGKRCCWP